MIRLVYGKALAAGKGSKANGIQQHQSGSLPKEGANGGKGMHVAPR
jgi:hypothetical protein